MNILIIEDDQFYAQHISELLQDRGLKVEVARSAEQGVGY
jgi:DNA-binding response OmpR family regulator